jgi:hypothetical protein
VPDRGSLPELQKQVGSDWIRTYPNQLSPEELKSGATWARNQKRQPRPDLARFSWPSIARDTLSMYEKLVASGSPGSHRTGGRICPDRGVELRWRTSAVYLLGHAEYHAVGRQICDDGDGHSDNDVFGTGRSVAASHWLADAA